jgi:ATP-dependent Clp protease ATP-binding subunit ClpA
VYVDQPSVAQTVSILRGLRERYEIHHGVCVCVVVVVVFGGSVLKIA